MSSVRGLNSLQASISPMVNKTLTTLLRFSSNHRNMTAEQLNIALGDPNTPPLPNFTPQEWRNIFSFICVFVLVATIGYKIVEHLGLLCNKEKMSISRPIYWIATKYNEIAKKEVLPIYRPPKAKESPYIGPEPTSPTLPNCPRLDGAERGQNIMFRLRQPLVRPQEPSENTTTETRITIVTVVENNGRPPLHPK
jgi:hypothetical protein